MLSWFHHVSQFHFLSHSLKEGFSFLTVLQILSRFFPQTIFLSFSWTLLFTMLVKTSQLNIRQHSNNCAKETVMSKCDIKFFKITIPPYSCLLLGILYLLLGIVSDIHL